mmetsp:Transcript_9216/g.34625  ORF Transcript_9216/g.34625 Transcript_9216/m.34625 type:complete len:236 (-) Transcript_9216:223-930(-)|eukprot:scaffold65_cov233-Pinguiococcus_pyrenoidosus.AAC.2
MKESEDEMRKRNRVGKVAELAALLANTAAALTICACPSDLEKGMKEKTRKLNAKQSEVRIRENLTNTLTRAFVDAMKEYQNAQNKYKSDIKKKITRQVQIVKPDVTEDEIDAIARSGKGASQVYSDVILTGVADDIKNAYQNVEDKYQDVLALEASIAEIYQMFLDFALVVDQQGEMLDHIETQVKSAADYIEDGNQDMETAIELQKSIRKKMCFVLVLLIIIGIVIMASVGVFG